MAQAFFEPLKETMLKHRQYVYICIFSHATLNETYTPKYDGLFFPEHPRWDQNPKFTPLSEMISITTPFICRVPPGWDYCYKSIQLRNAKKK